MRFLSIFRLSSLPALTGCGLPGDDPPHFEVTGRVVDVFTGAPAADACVEAVGMRGPSIGAGSAVEAATITNRSGYYILGFDNAANNYA